MVVTRSQTRPQREALIAKQKRKQASLTALRELVHREGRKALRLRRARDMSQRLRQVVKSFECGGCGFRTDMQGANVCETCAEEAIIRCFGCDKSVSPKTRTWMVECKDPGIYYWDIDYRRACEREGYGPISEDNRRGFEGPIPKVERAYYALAKWQNPWREDARKRPGKGGDPTVWNRTGCWVQGSVEEMRRLPFCVDCAFALPRESQGAAIRLWNNWQNGSFLDWVRANVPRGGLTSKDQFHCC